MINEKYKHLCLRLDMGVISTINYTQTLPVIEIKRYKK